MRRRSASWNPIKSGQHAYSGLFWIAPRVPSLKLGIAAALATVALGLILRFSFEEIALLVLIGTMLLAVETLNTALEMICDYVRPERDPKIGRIKDVSAAATAFGEIGGVLTVAVIMVPHVLHWLGRG